MTCLIYEDIRN